MVRSTGSGEMMITSYGVTTELICVFESFLCFGRSQKYLC